MHLKPGLVSKPVSGTALTSSHDLFATGTPQDVDQRLTRDVERLCDDLAALIPSMVKPVVDLAWFSVQLYQLTGRRGMAILYLYAFLGFGALSAVTPDFGALAKNVSKLLPCTRHLCIKLRLLDRSHGNVPVLEWYLAACI